MNELKMDNAFEVTVHAEVNCAFEFELHDALTLINGVAIQRIQTVQQETIIVFWYLNFSLFLSLFISIECNTIGSEH